MNDIITVNGEARAFTDQSVRGLLVALGLDPAASGLAVAVNARVVPRAEWDARRLAPGDRVEVVRPKAGG